MASVVDRQRLGLGLIAAMTTAVLVWFGTGLDPYWPFMWFAPLPVLLFAHRASWWGAAVVAAVGWLLGFLNLWHYLHRVINIPLTILVPIYSAQTLGFMFAVLLYRMLLRRRAYWRALLAFPGAWVSFEYLLNIISPHGTAGNLAYSQLKFLPFLQLAAVTGPWGMSFFLLLFSSALATGLHLRGIAPKQAWRVVAASMGAIVLVLLCGFMRLSLPTPAAFVKVGLVAWDPPDESPMAAEGAPTTKLMRAYMDQAAALAAQGARIIVLPEKLGVVVDPDTRGIDAQLQSLADKTEATIVVGLIRISEHKAYNEARIYAPNVPVGSYDKEHMLPSFESNLKPGSTLILLPRSSGTWGVEICKDMDFTPLSRRYGNARAGLMLVPAWDFDLDRILHGHMALMRGVESGFNIARAAKQGYLTVSDNRGRVLAETTSDSAHFATLLANVPTTHATTIYLLLGDWFAWLMLILLVFTLVQCFQSGPLPNIEQIPEPRA
jgi:apolipoprotein N-acyltransferase